MGRNSQHCPAVPICTNLRPHKNLWVKIMSNIEPAFFWIYLNYAELHFNKYTVESLYLWCEIHQPISYLKVLSGCGNLCQLQCVSTFFQLFVVKMFVTRAATWLSPLTWFNCLSDSCCENCRWQEVTFNWAFGFVRHDISVVAIRQFTKIYFE